MNNEQRKSLAKYSCDGSKIIVATIVIGLAIRLNEDRRK